MDHSGLGFDNLTFYYSDQFISDFIKLINGGSGFYKNDTQKKLAYIADSLNQLYPVANRSYSVFMENETLAPANSSAGWYVYNFRTILCLEKGLDRSYPNMSYMLNLEYNYKRTFINETGQRGTGLSASQLTEITNKIAE